MTLYVRLIKRLVKTEYDCTTFYTLTASAPCYRPCLDRSWMHTKSGRSSHADPAACKM